MNEYQIIISINGVFLFRTEWDSNLDRVKQAISNLKQLYEINETANVNIKVYKKDSSMVDIANELL